MRQYELVRSCCAVAPLHWEKSVRITAVLIVAHLLCWCGCERSSRAPLPHRLIIEVTGNEFELQVRYAGFDEKLGTKDDFQTRRNLALIAGRQTKIDLKSRDYIYSFALPHLDLKEIAVPDLDFALQFSPIETGEFPLKGDQFCGYSHPKLVGKVHVMQPREFAKWQQLATQSDTH